jgi:hypothetical protein
MARFVALAELTDTVIMRDLKRTNDVDRTFARVRLAPTSKPIPVRSGSCARRKAHACNAAP